MHQIPSTQLQYVAGGSPAVPVPLSLALIDWVPRNTPVIPPPRPRPPVA
jgi:hypothetical protein